MYEYYEIIIVHTITVSILYH